MESLVPDGVQGVNSHVTNAVGVNDGDEADGGNNGGVVAVAGGGIGVGGVGGFPSSSSSSVTAPLPVRRPLHQLNAPTSPHHLTPTLLTPYK